MKKNRNGNQFPQGLLLKMLKFHEQEQGNCNQSPANGGKEVGAGITQVPPVLQRCSDKTVDICPDKTCKGTDHHHQPVLLH